MLHGTSGRHWLATATVAVAFTTLGGSCGRIGFTADNGDNPADAAVDAERAVDAQGTVTCGPFGPAQRLDSTVAANYGDFGGFISDDGLTIVFSSDRNGGRILFQARRVSVLDDFSSPIPLVLPGGEDDDPWMSADGLSLYFNRSDAMWKSVRSAAGELFEVIQPVGAELGDLIAVDFSDDMLTFVGNQSSGQSLMSIGRRTTSEVPFTQITVQSELSADTPCCGTLSPDNSQLIYSVNYTTLNIATWSGTTFTNPLPFAPLGDVPMLDAHWSKSGRYLVFSAIVAPSTTYNLFLATANCS